jgi:hypothetical protein
MNDRLAEWWYQASGGAVKESPKNPRLRTVVANLNK